jgi:hydroxylamine dehydrogenase
MRRKYLFNALLAVVFFSLCPYATPGAAATAKIKISKEGQACIACHEAQSPSFVQEWRLSKHAEKSVDCYACHKAEKSDRDAMEHNGFTIAVLVSPTDCSQCHQKEVKEMTESHHAKAVDILNSLDNYLGEVVGGQEAVAIGCRQCHGSNVKVLTNGTGYERLAQYRHRQDQSGRFQGVLYGVPHTA